jgi:hypothetical protein
VNTSLQRQMEELADDVRVVDLRARVHAASHRVTVRRRIAVAAAAAAAVIAVVSGVVWAGSPSAQRDRGVPTGVDSVAPSTSTSTSAPPVAWATIPPTLYYQVRTSGGDQQRYELWWSDGTASERQFTPPGLACGMFQSPDQARVAWVAVGDNPGAAGDLWVASIDGNEMRRLLTDVTCNGLNVPRWIDADDLIATRDGVANVIEVETGKAADTSFGDEADDLVWSPDAQFGAYSASGEIVVCRPDGTVVRRVGHGDETPSGGFSLQGVSDDGRRVVLGANPSDPSQVRSGFRVVDTVTGKNVDLPRSIKVANLMSTQINTVPGNQLLVRVDEGATNKIYLLGQDGMIKDTRTEPKSLHDALLMPPTAE